MSTTNTFNDPDLKVRRTSLALTQGQLDTIDDAVSLLGWERSGFMRHAILLAARAVHADPAVHDRHSVLAGYLPPDEAFLPTGSYR